MKAVLLFLILILIAASSHATVPPDIDDEETDLGEGLAITASTMLSVANIGMIASKSPSYWIAGASMASGIVTLAFATQDRPPFQTGLWVTGATAIATGFVAMRYRYVLNQRAARIEPSWTHGSPGLALVIDF
jgi:hypothetical protein